MGDLKLFKVCFPVSPRGQFAMPGRLNQAPGVLKGSPTDLVRGHGTWSGGSAFLNIAGAPRNRALIPRSYRSQNASKNAGIANHGIANRLRRDSSTTQSTATGLISDIPEICLE